MSGVHVWGQPSAYSSSLEFVAEGAIPWVLLRAAGAGVGPTGGGAMLNTTYIKRLNTIGGMPPSSGCASSDDVGHMAFAPFTADYLFYEQGV